MKEEQMMEQVQDERERLKCILTRNMKHTNKTPESLAELVGVPVSVITWLLTGEAGKPTAAQVKKVFAVFSFSAEFLSKLYVMIDRVMTSTSRKKSYALPTGRERRPAFPGIPT